MGTALVAASSRRRPLWSHGHRKPGKSGRPVFHPTPPFNGVLSNDAFGATRSHSDRKALRRSSPRGVRPRADAFFEFTAGTQRAPPAICRRGSRSSASCNQDADDEEDEKASKPAGLAAEEVQQQQPG